MSTVVRFESVSKVYSRRETGTVKNLLLNSKRGTGRSLSLKAVDDVSFDISAGESVALLGHNGSGKSTILKMLAGVLRPSSGLVRARGRIAPLLELGSGFHPDLSGRENIFLNGAVLGIPAKELARRFDEIVEFSEMSEYLDMPIRFYSSGMVVRLGFAIAVNVSPEILLVDEVLAVGDARFQQKCLSRMEDIKSSGVTVVMVTHSRALAESFCERAIVLDHGRKTYDDAIDALGPQMF